MSPRGEVQCLGLCLQIHGNFPTSRSGTLRTFPDVWDFTVLHDNLYLVLGNETGLRVIEPPTPNEPSAYCVKI